MARRSEEHRKNIPGYDEYRPNRADRKRDHRKVRHAANQMLHIVADPEELDPLPEVMSDRHHDVEKVEPGSPEKRRFRVWKTKFWKRRDRYPEMIASMDAKWEEIANPVDEEDDW